MASWFTTSAPAAGYEVSRHWFGHIGRFAGPSPVRLIPRLEPAQLAAALREASFLAGGPLSVWVDDRQRAARLESGLIELGYLPQPATTHLALVGEVRSEPGPAGLRIEAVSKGGLARWANVKLKAFGDTEREPSRAELEREVALRSSEAEATRWWIAHLGGEAVAVLAHYSGRDQLVFNLGTRVPFRRRHIARALLSFFAEEGRRHGCRSLMINAEEGGRPEALYRRLGFTDEIYWCRRYERQLPPPEH